MNPNVGLGAFALGLCNTDDLMAQKAALIIPFNKLLDDINACAQITPQQKANFYWELEAFKLWIKEKTPFCNADASILTGRDFARKLVQWREVVDKAGCQIAAPEPVYNPNDVNDPRNNLGPGPVGGFLDRIESILKMTAIVGGIGLAAYAAIEFGPVLFGAIRSVSPSSSRKTARAK